MKKYTAAEALYLKAGNRIKSCFKDCSEFIHFFAELSDDINDHNKSFRFIGIAKEVWDTDPHYIIIEMLREIADAWIKGSDQDLISTMKWIKRIGGAEGYHHSILKALSCASWCQLAYGVDKEFETKRLRIFRVLLNVSSILQVAEKMEELERQQTQKQPA